MSADGGRGDWVRGRGMRYAGTLVEHHGTVDKVGDCCCSECVELDLFDPVRRAEVRLIDGTRLEHVRWSSLHRLGGRRVS